MNAKILIKNPWQRLSRGRQFNVQIIGRTRRRDVYHYLIKISWPRFGLWLMTAYLTINCLFGLLYFLLGPTQIEGMAHEGARSLLDSFFFSVQTLATIGYGRMTPIGLWGNLVVTVEALVGLVGVAVSTGLCYARFSRPTARVLFSRNVLITEMNGKPVLTFRIANERVNQLVEAQLMVVLAKTERLSSGEEFRRLIDLKLVRDRTPTFSLTWSILHHIDETSPLFGVTQEQVVREEMTIFTTLSGVDEVLSATVHDRYSYSSDDFVWNRRFKDMLIRTDDGMISVHLDRIHDYE